MNRTKKSLFVLETITFTKKCRRQKDDYQPFTTDVSFVSFHKRFEEAEASISRLLDKYNAWDFYCFYIYQVPFGFFSNPYYLDSYAVWLYDQTGNKIDERPYPSYQFGNYFCGRAKEKLRFHIGDVVCIFRRIPVQHFR